MFLFFLLGLPLFGSSTAYVFLQVRKQDDTFSNVDALIHKVVPSSRFEELAARMARKKFEDENAPSYNENHPKFPKHNHAVYQNSGKPNSDIGFGDLVDMAVKRFTKSGSGPMFRGKSRDYVFRPESVALRSGNSSLYHVGSDTIVEAINSMLSSNALRSYIDSWTRKAALAYRAVESGFFT